MANLFSFGSYAVWDDKREQDFGSLKSKGCLAGLFLAEDPVPLSKEEDVKNLPAFLQKHGALLCVIHQGRPDP